MNGFKNMRYKTIANIRVKNDELAKRVPDNTDNGFANTNNRHIQNTIKKQNLLYVLKNGGIRHDFIVFSV